MKWKSWFVCGFLEVEKEHFTLLDGQIVESRQGMRRWGLDMTSQLHGQHLPNQTKPFLNIIQRKIQQCFFSLLLSLDMEKKRRLVHLSALALTKYFPIKSHHLHTLDFFEKKQHTTFQLEKTRSRPTKPSRALRTQQVLPQPPGSVYILLAGGSGSVWLVSALTGNYQTIRILNYFDISSVESCRFPENMTCLWALGPVAPPEE